ncbi:porin [Candidatus Methylopumilus universalis]|uniref:porin n=1 Tax=Candidatus Methylopumilus universalis TaxID=2588536 RepID=UPI003BEF11E4
MNKNIKLAVAGAVLALSASANAGIIIPAGEWTLDINGNVNAFGTVVKGKGANTSAATVGGLATAGQAHENQSSGINTGLLPSWLGFTGKTRQNDVDVEFTISLQPNVSDNSGAGDAKTPLNRQAYVSFGDKSWGSIKLGKDLGIFAADAILNDMTLLGVGAMGGGAASGSSTTLGGIGTGYIYAAWKGQIAYTTPNFNGFQATVGITNPNQGFGQNTVYGTSATAGDATTNIYQDRFGLEGKASYSFSADALTGKIWVSGASYDVTSATTASIAGSSYTVTVADLGANLNAGNFGVTGYYYSGEGAGTTILGSLGVDANGLKRDSDGGYLQATYVLPTKTKLGLAYGISNLDRSTSTDVSTIIKSNERVTIGLYHPLTKHLNLVAEYNDIESKVHNGTKGESQAGSLGAILFF